MKYILDKPVV